MSNWQTDEIIRWLSNDEGYYLATKYFTRPAQFEEFCEEFVKENQHVNITEEEWQDIDWYYVREYMLLDEEDGE